MKIVQKLKKLDPVEFVQENFYSKNKPYQQADKFRGITLSKCTTWNMTINGTLLTTHITSDVSS